MIKMFKEKKTIRYDKLLSINFTAFPRNKFKVKSLYVSVIFTEFTNLKLAYTEKSLIKKLLTIKIVLLHFNMVHNVNYKYEVY